MLRSLGMRRGLGALVEGSSSLRGHVRARLLLGTVEEDLEALQRAVPSLLAQPGRGFGTSPSSSFFWRRNVVVTKEDLESSRPKRFNWRIPYDPNYEKQRLGTPFSVDPPPNETEQDRSIREQKEKLINKIYESYFPFHKWILLLALFGVAYVLSKITEWTDDVAASIVGEKVVSIVYESPEKFAQWVNRRPTTFPETFKELFDADVKVIAPQPTGLMWFYRTYIYPETHPGYDLAVDERYSVVDEEELQLDGDQGTRADETLRKSLQEETLPPATFVDPPEQRMPMIDTVHGIREDVNLKLGIPYPQSTEMSLTAARMYAEETNQPFPGPPEDVEENTNRMMEDLKVLLPQEFIKRVSEEPPEFVTSSPFSDFSKQQEVGKITIDHRFLRILPLRIMSRVWGIVAELPVPKILMPHLLSVYSMFYGCNLNEVDMDNSVTTASKGSVILPSKKVYYFRTIQDFFTRRIYPECRPLASTDAVSPVDGTVLSVGFVDETNNKVEQVKGLNYDVGALLGMTPKKKDPNSRIFHTIIYLAPGDYHGIHSPSEVKIEERNHFCGYLLPVATIVARTVPSLFAVNERVGLVGQWKHGFFSITAVGATNVGSISLKHEPNFTTNNTADFFRVKTLGRQVPFKKTYDAPLDCEKGEEIAFFRMGSTVVLVMEVPPDFETRIVPGQKIKLGEPVGTVPEPVVQKPSSNALSSLSSFFAPFSLDRLWRKNAPPPQSPS